MENNTGSIYTRQVALILWALFSIPAMGADPAPSEANIAKIYNIEKMAAQPIDVRYFRKNKCPEDEWCLGTEEDNRLDPRDWLLTGDVSRADLALMYDQQRYR